MFSKIYMKMLYKSSKILQTIQDEASEDFNILKAKFRICP